MEDGWWYSHGEDRRGPLSTEQLQRLVAEGHVKPDALVWRSGRLTWKPISEVPEFAQHESLELADSRLNGQGQRRDPVFDLVPLSHAPDAQVSAEADLPVWARTESSSTSLAPRFAVERGMLELPLAGPWQRLAAQLFDIWVLCAPVGFLLGLVVGKLPPDVSLWMSNPSSNAALGILMVPLSLIAQALLFGLFGTTPGKLIFGVRVTLLGGGRPTFLQYLRRLFRLYWSGLGMAVPFVTLFTMWRQYTVVSRGQPATYDVGRFQVHAASMGALRRSVAALGVVVILGGAGYIQHLSSEASNKYFAGFEWRNPISNKRVDIPSGWVFTQQMNLQGDPIFTFSSHDAGVVAVFAFEEMDESATLEQYQKAWVVAVRPQMAIDIRASPTNVDGRFALQMRGVMTNNASRLIHTTLVKNGGQVWRVVTVGMGGKEPESAATARLRAALFNTLPDRPARRESPESGNPNAPQGAAI